MGLEWNMIVVEFTATFVFVFTYFVIKNMKLDENGHKWMAIIGPLLISILYPASQTLNAGLSAGPMNPSLAL